MNTKNLHQIFKNYIDRFEELNDAEHNETFKWWAAKQFRNLMDKALQAKSPEAFLSLLKKIKGTNPENRVVETIIEGKMQPFTGLIKLAEKDNCKYAEEVRIWLIDLFQDDGGDLAKREQKIARFLQRSEDLRLKEFPKYYTYKQTARSVSGYLFLYDPNHYYMYKAAQAKLFADCVEFYGDWGAGDQIKLKEYYRMCDELVDEIKKCPELIKTSDSRLKNHILYAEDDMHKDEARHILAYDIIYCTSVYGLYKGLTFKPITLKEKKLYEERLQKALTLQGEYAHMEAQYAQLEQARQHYHSVLAPGVTVQNFSYGRGYGHGKVIACTDDKITVQFASQPVPIEFDFDKTIINHYLKFSDPLDDGIARHYRDLFERASAIEGVLSILERELEQYRDILE